MTGLIRSEILKLRTTNVWWAMLLGLAVLTGLTLTANIFQTGAILDNPAAFENPGQGDASNRQNDQLAAVANSTAQLVTNVYTSGQFFGCLLVMIFGIFIITNEYRHKTATATFLASPRRSQVVVAKLVTAIVWGLVFCAVTAALAIPIGAAYFSSRSLSLEFGNPDVIKSLLLNALAFGIWAIFGLGLGTLLKNQVWSVVVALVLYFGQLVVSVVLVILATQFEQTWILDVANWLPGGASQVAVSPTQLPGMPPWWAGALTLFGYGVVAAGVGAAVTTRRDIS